MKENLCTVLFFITLTTPLQAMREDSSKPSTTPSLSFIEQWRATTSSQEIKEYQQNCQSAALCSCATTTIGMCGANFWFLATMGSATWAALLPLITLGAGCASAIPCLIGAGILHSQLDKKRAESQDGPNNS